MNISEASTPMGPSTSTKVRQLTAILATMAAATVSGMQHPLALVHSLPTAAMDGMPTMTYHGRYSKRLRVKYILQLECQNREKEDTIVMSQISKEDNILQHQVYFIAKTVESFKLADLYWLESCVRAFCQHRQLGQICHSNDEHTNMVDRLAFHRPTASYLLGFARTEKSNNIKCNDTQRMLPFRSGHVQYVARVVASGQTPQELLNNIENTFISRKDPWTIEYDTFEPLQNPKHPKKSFSSMMLCCAISRILPGEPLLASSIDRLEEQVVSYMIIESAAQLYLAQKIPHDSSAPGTNNGSYHLQSTHFIAKPFRTAWSRRPFQYSGAINLDVALTVVDILRDLVQRNNGTTKTIHIIDPTCGSGTFLALALMAWGSQSSVDAVGIDSNPKCAHGTAKNLQYLFSQVNGENAVSGNEHDSSWKLTLSSDTEALSRITIYSDDSARLSTLTSQKFDCAVSNLPWNRNTFEFQGSSTNDCINSCILKETALALKPGAPLVVVSGGKQGNNEEGISFNVRKFLENLGFHILGESTIPPKGFSLPSSGKKIDRSGSKKEPVQRSSDCLITVALAPQET